MKTPPRSFLTFVAGSAVTMFLGWSTALTSAQPAASASSDIHVCVAADNVLHLVDSATSCPAGQRSMFFKGGGATAAGPQSDAPKNTPPDSSRPCADPARLNDLELELQGLEISANQGALSRKVVAPFEVVDRNGKRLFLVDKNAAVLYNSYGLGLAKIAASDNGGYFQGTSSNRTLSATIGSSGEDSGLLINDGKVRVDLGRNPDNDTYRAKFYGKTGNVVAAMGQAPATMGGAVQVYTSEGALRALVDQSPETQKGRVAVWQGERAVALLTEAAHGGMLAIYSSSGEDMVEAGVVPGGFGVVRAGPAGFNPGVGLLGLPGSYIAGVKK